MSTALQELLRTKSLAKISGVLPADAREREAQVGAILDEAVRLGKQSAAQEREAEERELGEITGHVAAFTAQAALTRFKASHQAGRCWLCGKNPIVKTSSHSLCSTCEASS